MVGLSASGCTPMLNATCGSEVLRMELSSRSRKKTPATVRTAARELLVVGAVEAALEMVMSPILRVSPQS